MSFFDEYEFVFLQTYQSDYVQKKTRFMIFFSFILQIARTHAWIALGPRVRMRVVRVELLYVMLCVAPLIWHRSLVLFVVKNMRASLIYLLRSETKIQSSTLFLSSRFLLFSSYQWLLMLVAKTMLVCFLKKNWTDANNAFRSLL